MSDNRTEHVFGTAPDARQGGGDEPISRFRKRYRSLTPEQLAKHDAIKDKFAELEKLILETCWAGRDRALAMTNLEQACMWAIKGLTAE